MRDDCRRRLLQQSFSHDPGEGYECRDESWAPSKGSECRAQACVCVAQRRGFVDDAGVEIVFYIFGVDFCVSLCWGGRNEDKPESLAQRAAQFVHEDCVARRANI